MVLNFVPCQECFSPLASLDWVVKKQGYKDSTIKSKIEILQRLVRLGANLTDPESVKTIIAKQQSWSDGRKANVIYTYTLFANWLGLKWIPPRVYVEAKLPYIPTERELDDLISACSLKVSCFLQLLKESAFRAGEAFSLRWRDINLFRGLLL